MALEFLGFLENGQVWGLRQTSYSDGALHRWGLHLGSFLSAGRSASLGSLVPRFVLIPGPTLLYDKDPRFGCNVSGVFG